MLKDCGDKMDKIFYGLNLIVDFIDTNELVNEKLIRDYLFFTGFDDGEVRQILALFDINASYEQKYFRIFSKTERNKFTIDAMNYIQKLILSGMLDFSSTEAIIERSQIPDSLKIGVETIKEHVLITLLEKKSGMFKRNLSFEEYVQ